MQPLLSADNASYRGYNVPGTRAVPLDLPALCYQFINTRSASSTSYGTYLHSSISSWRLAQETR
ncbi:MAG: hypothetical protein LQ344_001298 [Seirophora lacunosa]|nr:MAG: hypothetical protein LQ344_001298 [Seirophora lacunosa]